MNSEEVFDKYEEIIFNYLANNCSEFDDEHIKQLVNLKVKQYERLHSIIKEVREYIDRRDIEWGSEEHNHVLEILDKEK